jgi:hypothetical protein
VGNLERKVKQFKMKRHCKTNEVFIGHGGSQRNSNGRHFNCRVPTQEQTLGTVHSASVISMVNQLFQLLR